MSLACKKQISFKIKEAKQHKNTQTHIVEYENLKNKQKMSTQTQIKQKKIGVVRTVPLELVDAVSPTSSSAEVTKAHTKLNRNLADI